MPSGQLKRRAFLALGAAAILPRASRAQQAVPLIGYLGVASASTDQTLSTTEAFRRGLAETGYVEGRNVAIASHFAEGRYERLAVLAADLVRRRVAVIAACGSSAPALAAKAATLTIPIVFQTGADPVADGLVASMNRPGGNVTGVSRLNTALEPKRLELLHEAVPNATVVAYLLNPNSPRSDSMGRQMREPARLLGLDLPVVNAGSGNELEAAFTRMVQLRAGAVLIGSDPSMNPWVEQIAALALRHRLPTMLSVRQDVVAGGLMSYDSSLLDSYRQVGVYAGRILKGEKPADLPVVQPTKFELVLNLKTAKALGIDIPLKLQAFAEEVIE
jgi:putative ABC transport system substrate-binding protein